jgi:hypothetical protein
MLAAMLPTRRRLLLDLRLMPSRSTRTIRFSLHDDSLVVQSPQHSENVPVLYVSALGNDAFTRSHLRWMLQKYSLGQDMYLVGAPGSVRRRLAMAFAEMCQKEVEVLTLSQDTTEADLKQRREIKGGSAFLVDQAPVRAAMMVRR